MKGYLFGPIVLRRAEYHIECDFSRTSCLPARNNSLEGCVALLNVAPVYFHFVEGFLVDEVQSAGAIHEHFGEPKAIHNWTEDQRGWCPDCLELRFVTGAESYGRVNSGIYCCDLADFGEAAECSLAPVT